MEKVPNLRNRKEKGLTLVEVVVSLAVVVIVSLAVVSIVVSSSSSLQSASLKGFFTHEVDTLGNLFLSYPDASDYHDAMLAYTGKNVTRGTDYTLYYDASFHYAAEEGSFYYLTAEFDGAVLRLASFRQNGNEIVKKEVGA
ncbi:MAG: prepilin-type N-terminal cleavage/methylation domain-containing protein [Bacilli bacterium]|nr:prepilin-type N-terminal cleavage/methylation domain-containing protein [Bacilli bacterium]